MFMVGAINSVRKKGKACPLQPSVRWLLPLSFIPVQRDPMWSDWLPARSESTVSCLHAHTNQNEQWLLSSSWYAFQTECFETQVAKHLVLDTWTSTKSNIPLPMSLGDHLNQCVEKRHNCTGKHRLGDDDTINSRQLKTWHNLHSYLNSMTNTDSTCS